MLFSFRRSRLRIRNITVRSLIGRVSKMWIPAWAASISDFPGSALVNSTSSIPAMDLKISITFPSCEVRCFECAP